MQHRQMNMHCLDLDLEGYEPKGWRLPMQRDPRPRYLRAFPEPKRGVLKACKLYVYDMGPVARGGTLSSAVAQRSNLSLVSTPNPPNGVNAVPEEYLTIPEVAARLKVTPKTIRNKMASGVFGKGQHYVRPPGLGTRFKWGAVVAWLEREETGTPEGDSIPMARGYELGEPSKKDYGSTP